ncbi:MAG: hypothetical protein E7604_04120 [Ruminococcaceae bacterium]|nr:hypothetical protein [Oscillospiraceae bacterium]
MKHANRPVPDLEQAYQMALEKTLMRQCLYTAVRPESPYLTPDSVTLPGRMGNDRLYVLPQQSSHLPPMYGNEDCDPLENVNNLL